MTKTALAPPITPATTDGVFDVADAVGTAVDEGLWEDMVIAVCCGVDIVLVNSVVGVFMNALVNVTELGTIKLEVSDRVLSGYIPSDVGPLWSDG